MVLKSFDSLDKILQYTAVATNALHDVAAATQIPFLESFCTLSLTIIPVVQVWQLDSESLSWLTDIVDHKISNGPMPSHDGGHSPVALCSHEPVQLLG
jgi:hypothetical protein